MWRDFVNTPPADGQLIIARRHPEDTVPIAGSWAPDKTGLLVGPNQWFIPWPFITRWKPNNGEVTPGAATVSPQPAISIPPNPSAPIWRDPYQVPPVDQQSCWVRRCPADTAAFLATFRLDTEPYFLLSSGWQLPWYMVLRWRTRT